VSQLASASIVAASVLGVLVSAFFLFVFNPEGLSDRQIALLVPALASVFVASLTCVLYLGRCF
jgi:hypothetical protein